mgnify:CR=1 FL=1
MSLTSVKLGRLTLNAISKLREDPTAISRVEDAYQGYVRPDTSVAENLERSAKKWDAFGPAFTDLLNKQVTYSNKKGTEEGHDKWLHMSASQKKTYGDAVKKGDIGSWDSPYVNREMSRMFMADEANKFTAGFDTAAMKARVAQGDDFDLSKWSQKYTSDFMEINNLTDVPPDAFNIFGRSIEKTITQAHQKEAVLQATKFEAEFEQVFQGDIMSLVNNTSLPQAEISRLLKDKFKKHSDLGFENKTTLERIKKSIAAQVILLTEDGDNDRIDSLFDLVGNLPTGMKRSKAKGGGFYTQAEVGEGRPFSVWKALVEKESADTAYNVMKRDEALEVARVGKQIKDWSLALSTVRAEGIAKDETKSAWTQDQWLQTEEGKALQKQILATVSGDEKILAFQQGLRNTSITAEELATYKSQFLSGAMEGPANPEDIKLIISRLGGDLRQMGEMAEWWKTIQSQTVGQAIPEFIDGVVESISGKSSTHLVKQSVRDSIAYHAKDTYYERVEEIMSSGMGVTEKRNAIQIIKEDTQASVDKQLQDALDNKAKDFKYAELTPEVTNKADVFLKEDAERVSDVMVGMRHEGRFKHYNKLMKGGPETWSNSDRLYIDNFHLTNNPQIDLVSEVYDIPKNEQNLPELIMRAQVLMPYLNSKIVGDYGVDKKVYNQSVQTLDNYLKKLTGVDNKPETGTKESNVKVVPPKPPYAEPKSSTDVIDEESTEKVNIGGDSLATKVIDGVTNAVVGKEANASQTGTLTKRISDGATKWMSDNYNGSNQKERAKWRSLFNERVEQYLTGTHPEIDSAREHVAEMSDTIFESGKAVFGKELANNQIEVRDVEQHLIGIYGAETNFGVHPDKVSPTGALGEMQIMPSTFRSLVKGGVLGKNYAKAIGVSNLKSLSSEKIKDLLLNNPKANYLAAMGKYLNRIKHHNIKGGLDG